MPSLAVPCLALILILSGCTVLRRDDGEHLPAPPDQLGLVEGTALQVVLDRLGPPTQVSSAGEGFAFLYEKLSFSEYQIGVEFPGIDWLKIAGGKATTDREVAILVFDAERTLVGAAYTTRTDDLGLGGGIQIIVQVEGVVNTESIEDLYGVHDWGGMLLHPLPRGLNRESNLDSGENGFEILGTPRRVGQHTLEEP